MDEAKEAASVKVMHDARAVHDMASLNLVDLLRHGTPQWTIARITPAANSGFATIPGDSINAAVVLMKQGTWTAIAGSGPHLPSNETYSLAEPFRQMKRSPTLEDYYSPFIKGGVVIVGTTRPWTSLQELGPVYLTFDNWASDMPEAMTFVLRDSSLFQDSDLSAATSELIALLSRDNPLLQIQAFRRLITLPGVPSASIEKHLSSASVHLAAVFTQLLLSERKDGEWGQTLVHLLDSAKSDASCRGIALGAYATKLFCGNEPKISRDAESVLSAARFRFATFVQQDDYLDKLLQ
jgi:hypothetical protein